MSTDREYMRVYMLRRYHRRRNKAIADLGGKCKQCDSTCNLEIDHIDSKSKSYNIAKIMTSGSDKILIAELAKCQILCRKCHEEKSIIDAGNSRAKHGTSSMYTHYKCKCEPCRLARNADSRRWKANRKLKINKDLTN